MPTSLLEENTEVEEEEELAIPSKAIQMYRDKQRVKREWSHELERWKQLGIKVQRSRRSQTRSEQLTAQARRLATKFVLAQQEDTAAVIERSFSDSCRSFLTWRKMRTNEAERESDSTATINCEWKCNIY